ncbi:hypothetical protein PHLCEN_2v3390 [Hermanssonia centrifuga]|uniref:Glutathione S-transferase n=1 Tax=Hermanssonia centrifuga TaxID=98765 RepID=A0A2R6QIS4_9APHY|nr:hypothetical protein PHLCEN_2v3390 [Hermanssonia centrifuga]
MSHGKQFTLYSHVTGPNGWKVAVVLEELGLTYETIYLDFKNGEHKAPEFTKYNPNGRIPALIDHRNNDYVLWESGAIIIYLIENYDPEHKVSLASAGDKLQIIQWLFFQASGQGFNHSEKLPSAIERYQKEIIRVLGVLEGVLSKTEWLVGNKCTVADLSFIHLCSTNRWNEYVDKTVEGFDNFNFEKDFPAVFAWHKRLTARASFEKVVAVRTIKQSN